MNATEAEKAVLGAILLDNTVLPLASDIVHPEDFYLPVHRDIFTAMQALDASGKPIDLATVTVSLLGNKYFEEAGSTVYLAGLMHDLPAACQVKVHANIVRNDAVRRKLNTYALDIAAKTQEAVGDCGAFILQVKDKLDSIVGTPADVPWQMFDETAREALKDVVDMAEGNNPGIETGFRELDEHLSGLRPGSLSIVAARPGMGKTAFALNILQHVAIKKHIPAAMFSLEMTSKELAMRVISGMAGVSGHAIRSGKLSHAQWEALFRAVESYKDTPIVIDQTAGISISALRDRARRMQLEKHIQFIAIDYLQLMTSGSKRAATREQEVADISRGLKALAKDLNVPVLCLAQLNRGVETRADKRPFMSDLRESGSIEQDADNIMFIHREGYYDKAKDDHIAEIIIAKQRAGATGTIKLHWNGATTTFSNPHF